jgi:hypothetical protein
MQRSSVGGAASLTQPIHSGKRAWNDPSITDENVSNTAAKPFATAETPTTNGPAS